MILPYFDIVAWNHACNRRIIHTKLNEDFYGFKITAIPGLRSKNASITSVSKQRLRPCTFP